jgi:outer membrane receptor protein involved in Fe transport
LPVIFHVTNYQVGNTLTWVKASTWRIRRRPDPHPVLPALLQQQPRHLRLQWLLDHRSGGGPPAGHAQPGDPDGRNQSNYLFFNNWGFFAQDDWRVTSTLTLNIGLRTSCPAAARKYGRISNLVPPTGWWSRATAACRT